MMLTAVTCACLSVAAAAPTAVVPTTVVPVEAPRPAATVLLQYRFQPGEAVRYTIENESTLMARKGDTHEKTYSKSSTEQQIDVASVDAGGVATLRLSIASARMEYAFNGAAPTVLSSEKKNLPDGVAKVMGRPLAEIRIRPDGTADSLEPLLTRAELETVPGKLGLDEEAAGSLFMKLPAGPVAVGDEWHETMPVRVSVTRTLSQEVTILKQYRLDAIEDGVAVIGTKSSVLTSVTEPAMLVQLIPRTSSGTIRFDVEAGRIIDRAADVDNTAIGWHGPDSSMRAVCRTSGTLVVEPAAVSSR